MTLESDILRAQERIFRFAARDHGLSLKAISLDSGINYETLRSYAGNKDEQAMMPVSALCKLVGVVPDSLLSQLLEPVGRAIVPLPSGIDFDEISGICQDFIATKERAHHPESEAGRDIGPNEERELGGKVARLRP